MSDGVAALRERNDYLEEEVRQLRGQLREAGGWSQSGSPDAYRLRKHMEPALVRIFLALLKHGRLSRDQVMMASADSFDVPEVTPATASVQMHKLRRKLAAIGVSVEISTIYKYGYVLADHRQAVAAFEAWKEGRA